jgi:hypothetical protein
MIGLGAVGFVGFRIHQMNTLVTVSAEVRFLARSCG